MVSRYTKRFQPATRKRWYIELVCHDKEEYNAWKAESKYGLGLSDKEGCMALHELAGCYLDVLREEYTYYHSVQGRIDCLRDEIVDADRQLRLSRENWERGKLLESVELQKLAQETGAYNKQLIENNNNKILQLMMGKNT